MKIIPAVDILNGRCVRLLEGDFSKEKKYFDDPVKAAEKWSSLGASMLHIVDLDGAKNEEPKNIETAIKIKREFGLNIQYGGGIRKISDMERLFEGGINRVIIGTRAIEDRKFLKECLELYGERILVSLDYGTEGKVYKKGWLEGTGIDVAEILADLEKMGSTEAIVTDISKDGTLKGVNIMFIKTILKNTNIRLIIAGGISGIKDIEDIKKIEDMGISGVIIGKALYENKIDLADAIAIGIG